MSNYKIAEIFVWIAALFMIIVIANIAATFTYTSAIAIPKPWMPKPPSCCGDSICLIEGHHE